MIGTRAGWAERLRERGYALRGHRLVRDRAADGPVRLPAQGTAEDGPPGIGIGESDA